MFVRLSPPTRFGRGDVLIERQALASRHNDRGFFVAGDKAMQCSNCGFQNMPGSEVCGRCSTSLGVATAVMDVHPPRASALTKRVRRILPVRRAYFRTRARLGVDPISARVGAAIGPLPAFGVMARLIVPGWSHFYINQRLRGVLFLLAYGVCLLPAFLLFGTTWGNIWLGLAFSVHSSAGLDVVTRTFVETDTRGRIVRSIVISLVLFVLLYLPAGWWVSGVANPNTVQTALGAFQVGDVIWVNRWKTPARGDVVLYDVDLPPEFNPRAGHRRVVVYTGENIDRILAVPGDTVECKAGRLIVNDSESKWLPLYPASLGDSARWTLPPGQYLILPSRVPGGPDLENPDIWQTTGRVSRERILGRAYLQSLPLAKIHLIR